MNFMCSCTSTSQGGAVVQAVRLQTLSIHGIVRQAVCRLFHGQSDVFWGCVSVKTFCQPHRECWERSNYALADDASTGLSQCCCIQFSLHQHNTPPLLSSPQSCVPPEDYRVINATKSISIINHESLNAWKTRLVDSTDSSITK